MKIKKLLLIAVFVFAITSLARAQVPKNVITNGLVAYYPFNGNANDESGNNYNGSNTGAIPTQDRFGNKNQAYYFDGSSSYIHLPTPDVGEDDGLATWVCWFKTPTDYSPEHAQLLDIFQAGGFHLSYGKVGGGMEIGSGDRNYVYDSLNQVNDDQWHFVVLSYDDLNLRLYVDGELRDMVTDGVGQIDYGINYGIYLGMGGYHVNYLLGSIDDVGIWDRPLSHEEILYLYSACNLSILTQPIDQTANLGDNAQFIISASDTNIIYQWQTNIGFGFQNLSNAGQYVGTTNDTLIILNTSLTNNNQYFRCIVSRLSTDTSEIATLTVLNNAGISKNTHQNIISAFPNPAINKIEIIIPANLIGSKYKIDDFRGKSVLCGNLEFENSIIDLSNLSSGIYLLRVGDNPKNTIKVVKN